MKLIVKIMRAVDHTAVGWIETILSYATLLSEIIDVRLSPSFFSLSIGLRMQLVCVWAINLESWTE